MQWRALVFTFLCLESLAPVESSFPDNLEPINQLKQGDLPTRVFTGSDANGLRHVQLIKKMKVLGEEKIVLAARENIYLVDPEKFASLKEGDVEHDSVVTWKSDKHNRDLCMMKGQPDELCYNFNSVFEALDEQGNMFLVCGTDSFNPNCTKYQAVRNEDGVVTLVHADSGYFTGQQRCPFGPNQPSASLFTGNSLYSGTFQAFSGGSPVISRTMGENPPLRTPNGAETMNNPSFVAMAEDKDRVFVFFNEHQALPGGERRLVAQVGQICKNDQGGERVLQRMWTTFVKSRLNCSYNGFYFNELRDVSEAKEINGQMTVFATFTTPRNSLPGSAVCSFTLDAIREALQGPFQAESADSSAVPPSTSMRPGFCPTNKLSDAELRFVKSNPQMQKQAQGTLLFTNVGSRYTATSVDTSAGPEHLPVFYVGSEDGSVVRRLAPMSKRWPLGALLSEQLVYDENRCSPNTSKVSSADDRKVLKILLDPESDSVTVAFRHCTVSAPMRTCHLHQCKSSCVGSADPYCGWDGSSCIPYITPKPRLEQDLGNAIRTPLAFSPCEIPTSWSDPSILISSEEGGADKTSTSPTPVGPPGEKEDEDDKDVDPVAVGDTLAIAGSQYDFKVLIAAVLGTFVLTVLLMILGMCLMFRCRRKDESSDDLFKKKQMMQIQMHMDQDKRGSLGRKAQQTYRGCLDWFCRPNNRKSTPAATPKLSNKSDIPVEVSRSQNNYSEAPTLQMRQEQAKRQRRASSRQNSTTSVSSNQNIPRVMRKDSVLSTTGRRPMSQQPLLSLSNETYEPVTIFSDGTLPHNNHITDSSNIPLHPGGIVIDKRSSQASSSGGSHSPLSSNDSHMGAAETGVLPTASAKMRRRNERAQNQTNEIMRESDCAIRDFQMTLNHMEFAGIPTQGRRPLSVARQRLDSNDSGKGESPRNSLRTDLEQSQMLAPRNPRPNSLNLQRNSSGRRKRMLSEPSYSPEGAPSAFIPPFQRFHSIQPQMQPQMQPQHQPQMTPNGRNTRSQPTTPIGGPSSQKLALYQPLPDQHQQQIYGTLPKPDLAVAGRRKQRQQAVDPGFHAYVQQRSDVISSNRVANCDVTKQRRDAVTRSCGSPVKSAGAPNRYPSLLVRGTHAAKTIVQQPPPRSQGNSPPKNHYPSLPHRSSSAPFGNNGFERPSTLHRREQLPSFVRQTSGPLAAAGRPMYVPPPTVPTSGF